jgi:ABC-type multidrug transport system fused ATPase/permease subunit
VAAVGVSLFYTFSVSSIIPVLKIIFAEHESLVDWLHRAETQRRLGIVAPADLPDDPHGLAVLDIRPASLNADVLRPGDHVVFVPESEPGATPLDAEQSSFAVAQRLAASDANSIADVRLVAVDNTTRTVTLQLKPHGGWWQPVYRIAHALPTGEDPAARLSTLVWVMVLVVVISTLGAICRFINEGFVALAVQRAMHDLRTGLADHAMRLPIQWHSMQPAGDTLSRFATDLSKVEVGITTVFGKVIREPLKAVGVLALALLLDWHMLVIGLIGLPIGAVFIRLFGRLVKRAQRRASESWGRLLDHLDERLAGIRIVKAYNMQAAESRRFETEGRELTRAQTQIEWVDAASSPVLEMLASLAVSAFVLYGGTRVFHQELEPHLFFGAVICLGGIFDPLRKMGNVYNRLQSAEASARRLFELMDLPTEEATARGAVELAPLQHEIEFDNVNFAYPTNPERPVLADVTLRVRKGQVVALVGPNGSGKTTLVSLLLRFFEPTRGRICFDGQDIADATLTSLRGQIGLVTQEAVIFSDTVRGNIAYGENGTSPGAGAGVQAAAVERAAQQAHIDDFVRTLRVQHDGRVTTGYDALINSRTLSGGQRQRIVIARAVLRDPPILILDEATSQVDSESERKIQEALEDVMRDRTTFIIAHRYSTIARADLIVVLNDGRVVGVGQHDDLLRTCPFYTALVRTQFAHA